MEILLIHIIHQDENDYHFNLYFLLSYELKIFLVHFKPTPNLNYEQKNCYPNLGEWIYWVKDKLKVEGSNHQLAKVYL